MDLITYALCKKLLAAAMSGIEKMYVVNNVLYIETKDGEILEIVFPIPENVILFSDSGLPAQGQKDTIYVNNTQLFRWNEDSQLFYKVGITWEE